MGPFTLAWHGLMIAVGILAGIWMAQRYAKEEALSAERITVLVFVLVIAGTIGARIFFLLLETPSSLLRPTDWFETRGFAFFGALIAGPAAVGVYMWRSDLSARYLDALAAGFPLGMAVGRVGDIISGEHYGPVTTAPWGFRYLDPDAEVPSSQLAYHQGAFYEVLVALAMLAILWPLRHRFQRPLTLFWTTVAAYGVGRFLIFFYRSDTADFALGMNAAQATSLAFVAGALLGLWRARRVSARASSVTHRRSSRGCI